MSLVALVVGRDYRLYIRQFNKSSVTSQIDFLTDGVKPKSEILTSLPFYYMNVSVNYLGIKLME